MFFKVIVGVVALGAVAWWVGVDTDSAKESVVGIAHGNAQSLSGTNRDSDWGG
jgi:hypothetical protein